MDFQLTQEVNCSSMNIKDIKIAVYSYHEILDVRFNNASLDYQVTPNTPFSQWLWLLDVDYEIADLEPYTPVTVQVRSSVGRIVWEWLAETGSRAMRACCCCSPACLIQPSH